MKRQIKALAFVVAALALTGLAACDETSDNQAPPAQQGSVTTPSMDAPTALS